MWTKKYFQKIWRWGCLCYLLLFALLCSASPAVYVLFFGPPSSAQAAETTPSATSPLHEKTVVTLPPASISPREIKLDADVSIFIQNRIDRGFDTASAQIRDHFTFLLTIIGIVNAILLSVFSIFTFLQVKSAEKDAENARKDAEKAHACTEEAEKYLNDIKTLKKKALEEFDKAYYKISENKTNEQAAYPNFTSSEDSLPVNASSMKEEDYAREFNEGLTLYNENKIEEARNKWENLGNQGYIPAQYRLGNFYGTRKEGGENPQESAKWYEKAAKQGFSPAQWSLAFCYGTGYGVEKNLQKAIYWYKQAAEKFHPLALIKLVGLYLHGKGVPKNPQEAYKCLLLYQAATGDITTYAKTLEALEEELSREEIHDAQQKATSLFEGNSVKKDTQ